MQASTDPSPDTTQGSSNQTQNSSNFSARGGRDLPYNRMIRPKQHPVPPRPRPTIFYYLVTLVYAQNGFTRKFRHYLPCQHNVVFHAIADTTKRYLYAAGSDCLICPCCDETVLSHIHLNIYQCPTNVSCPLIRKIPAMQISGRIEHFCGLHQITVPHPNDLNHLTNLPTPLGAPCQFSFHSTMPQDSILVVNALYGRQQPISAVPAPAPVPLPRTESQNQRVPNVNLTTYPLLSEQLENVSSLLRFPRVDTRNPGTSGSSQNLPPTPQETPAPAEVEVSSEPSDLLEDDGPELRIVESEIPPINTDEEEDPLYIGEAALNLSARREK